MQSIGCNNTGDNHGGHRKAGSLPLPENRLLSTLCGQVVDQSNELKKELAILHTEKKYIPETGGLIKLIKRPLLDP